MPASVLLRWAASADVVIAADSGANRLVTSGFIPSKIVGDMDSVSQESLASGAEVVRDENEDETDCDKLLAVVREDGFSQVTLVSVEGDLPDHELATLTS